MVHNNEYQEAVRRVYYSDVAERYDDMVDDILYALKIAKEQNKKLDITIRNYFSIAFKNIVSKKRASWRLLNNEKQKNPEDSAIIDEKLSTIIREILDKSNLVLETIEKYMPEEEDLKNAEDRDNILVFVYKTKGDYLRYKAEVQTGDKHENTKEEAMEAYKKAIEYSKALLSTDPLRLGLSLNYSVFFYEIMEDADKACKIAKDAFELAVSELDQLNETHYKDSTLIMQLLRDNITLWTTRNDVKK
ncbi:hypothetical protein EHP00_455 [Ecytonucleospora hepatopenaei]|uniref:14-3-3 domain-containing protein n=1 Tax=Ecytonucleospora hepatopenaei TaxID=646526 RepID=A0A1W0E907_9MICR|nr:hypothetical protein EHP00_455 [Ecytonucleospora hepatopenaei]